MSTLPTTKRIAFEDIKEAPSWGIRLVSQINVFFSAFYDAVNGNLTFGENISSQMKDLTFATLSDYSTGNFPAISFPNLLRRRAVGVIPLQITQIEDNYTPIQGGVSLDWYDIDGKVQINFVSGLLDSTSYRMKVMVI